MTDAAQSNPGRATLHRLGGEDGAPDLLLIHGFASDRFAWSATAPDFFRTHRVWAVELPGHTAAPIDAGSGDPAAMALAVIAALAPLQAPMTIVGHSLGGAVAVGIAARRPDLVSSLVLIAPAGVGGKTRSDFLKNFPALETADDARPLLEQLVARPKLIGPQMVQYVLGFLDAPGRREALRRIGDRLSEIGDVGIPAGVPTVAVWGDADTINVPSSRLAEIFGDRLHLLQGVGHMPHVEQARATNAIIRAALKPADPA